VWSYTSTPLQYASTAWYLVKHKDDFTFTFTFTWVWNLVPTPMERTVVEGVYEHGDEEIYIMRKFVICNLTKHFRVK